MLLDRLLQTALDRVLRKQSLGSELALCFLGQTVGLKEVSEPYFCDDESYSGGWLKEVRHHPLPNLMPMETEY